jgi:cryptochrome
MHHLGRHAVACFLTRGDLFKHWELGMDVFDEWLIDRDYAMNAGNWMWVSASAFFHQYRRIYSPTGFGKKTDPNGDFIRKYIPALASYPSKYIYAPWEAPTEVQQEAGCIIGRDYPQPIVDHAAAKDKNLSTIAAYYRRK